MTYKIGTRVRKVRHNPSSNQARRIPLGAEGVIVSMRFAPRGTMTPSGPLLFNSDCKVMYSGGDVRSSHTSVLEPIIPDGHRAGIKRTCEPLDKLLSEVSREAV